MRLGTSLMLIGLALVLVGALVRFSPLALSWFGNLPGDIRSEGDSTRVVIPITSMIVVSVVLTVLLNTIGFFLRSR